MTRVLQYGLSSSRGGIETYLWNLARTVNRATLRFDYLYSDVGKAPAFSAELSALGGEFHGVTPRRVSPSRNRKELAELITPRRFDILHFHVNTASYVEPVRAALRSGVKVIVHSHNSGASRSPITQTLHRVNARALPWRHITKVAVSDEARHWMFGRAKDVLVIPNGIDVADFQFDPAERERIRMSLDIRPDTFVVGQIGAFLPAKNHEFTLAVFADIVRHRPNSRLLLIGGGPSEARMKDRVRDLGLAEKTRFLGERADVPNLLSALDHLLFPSRYEGFGLVALEAQAAGLPCSVSEAVPPGVVVLPCAQRLPLSAGHGSWADAVLTATPQDYRSAAADQVQAAGLGLRTNTAELERLYSEVSRA